jgi:hypothetical protein
MRLCVLNRTERTCGQDRVASPRAAQGRAAALAHPDETAPQRRPQPERTACKCCTDVQLLASGQAGREGLAEFVDDVLHIAIT